MPVRASLHLEGELRIRVHPMSVGATVCIDGEEKYGRYTGVTYIFAESTGQLRTLRDAIDEYLQKVEAQSQGVTV